MFAYNLKRHKMRLFAMWSMKEFDRCDSQINYFAEYSISLFKNDILYSTALFYRKIRDLFASKVSVSQLH